MKRNIFLLFLVPMLFLSACSAKDQVTAPTNGETTNPNPDPEFTSGQPANPTTPETSLKDPIPAPADSAQYRGTVEEVSSENGETRVVLKQAKGTNFGSEQLACIFNSSTKANFDPASLKIGTDYIEVYYGAALSTSATPNQVTVLVSNLLLPAETSIFNGTVIEITEISTTDGTIKVASLDRREEVVFRYNSESKIYLTLKDLKAGDMVNIYFPGVMAMSMPPQATILELRIYAE